MSLLYFAFYATAILPILYESICIYSPKEVLAKNAELKGKDPKSLPKRDLYYLVYGLGYVFWSFIGLFTSQWFLFILLLLLGVIAGIIKKIFGKIFISWFVFDSTISLIILLLIILNRYHFHITFSDITGKL